MLVQDGKLRMDAPIQEACPAFPRKQAPITLRELLAHTAGVRHYDYRRFAQDYLNDKTFRTIPEAFAKFAADPLVSAPGDAYHYSSWGYVVVACAMEGASGESFRDLLATTILRPAGMRHSLLDAPGLRLPARAAGYSLQKDGGWKATGVQDPSDRYGASGLLSTPVDLASFANALLDGRYLRPGLLQAMWSPQALSDGGSSNHGLGWDFDPQANAVAKDGTAYDASSYLYVVPAHRVVVAISANLALWDDGRDALAKSLAATFDPTLQ